jgi:hypothetical protein
MTMRTLGYLSALFFVLVASGSFAASSERLRVEYCQNKGAAAADIMRARVRYGVTKEEALKAPGDESRSNEQRQAEAVLVEEAYAWNCEPAVWISKVWRECMRYESAKDLVCGKPGPLTESK